MKKETENKGTEKARVLAGIEFAKWLFMGGAMKPYNETVAKRYDTMRAYGLEINADNCKAVRHYYNEFLLILSMYEAVEKEESK